MSELRQKIILHGTARSWRQLLRWGCSSRCSLDICRATWPTGSRLLAGIESFDFHGRHLGLFQEKAIIIDYPKQKLVIINETIPADYDVDNWQKLDFKLDRFGIAIYARIDGGDYKRFILDSGSNISLIRPNSVGLNKIENNCDAILTPGKECSAIKTQNFIINGIDSGSMFFYLYSFEEPAADGILGYDFLADKAIYIDFKKRIMRLLQRK